MANVSSMETIYWYDYIVNIRYMSESDFSNYLWIYLYIRPVFVILGSIGNILALLVLFRANLRSKSFTVYLRALAVCDTGSLLGRLLMWINLVRDQLDQPFLVSFNSSLQCWAVEYIFTSVHACSGWLVVAVAWERAVVITFPLRSRIIASPKMASFVTSGIISALFASFTYVPLTTSYVENYGCVMTSSWKLTHYYIAVALVAGLPFTFVAAANLWIVVQLRRAKMGILSTQRRSSSLADRKVNRMLLTVTIFFFVLLVPNALFVMLYSYENVKIPLIVSELARVSVDVNYAINFYLYVFSGEQIRVEARNMLACS